MEPQMAEFQANYFELKPNFRKLPSRNNFFNLVNAILLFLYPSQTKALSFFNNH